jgi:hypothetical protein
LHSRVHVCDEIGDLLVALTKCPNAPILIVVEIHGAIHVLIHAVISVPEVVPVHLDRRQELADRPDRVRAAQLALVMMIVVVILVAILVVAIVIAPHVVTMEIDPVAIVDRVASLVTVPVEIVVLVVNSVIDLLVILVAATVIVPLVVMALMPVVILVIVPVAIAVLVVSTVTVRPEIVPLIVNSVTDPVLIVVPVVNMATDLLVIVHPVVILVTDPVVTVGRVVIGARAAILVTDLLVIVGRVVNMATDRFVVTTVLNLVVAIVIVPLAVTMEIDPAVTVIVHRAVMIQVLTHVAATETVRLVAMALVLDVRQAHVVMTAVTVVVAVDRVAKTSHLVGQRTKLNVVARPCACAVAVKCAKTASKHRCHAKPRPGLTKVELKTTYVMLPKVPCAVHSHRDALCRRDQKMKTN